MPRFGGRADSRKGSRAAPSRSTNTGGRRADPLKYTTRGQPLPPSPQLSTMETLVLKMPPTPLVHAAGWGSGGHPRETGHGKTPTVISGFGNPCYRIKIPCSSQNNSLIAGLGNCCRRNLDLETGYPRLRLPPPETRN